MRVVVKTVSRLHFGFTSLSADMGRCFGSIGLALDSPTTNVEVSEGDTLEISGGNSEKILFFVKRFAERYAVDPRVFVAVRDNIPEHTGLGSGTQLALAIGVALAKIHKINADIPELSGVMGRGRRSGIGIGAFELGGFIIDAGHKNRPDHAPLRPPTIVFRRDFPDNWCFVIVIPDVKRGLNGPGENRVFQSLSPSRTISGEICRLTHLRLLPALIEEDIMEFGIGLTEIDRQTGMYFKNAQGGIYGESSSNEILDCMLEAGARGVGQSSWGPAIYGLAEAACANTVEGEVKSCLKNAGREGTVLIARGCNRGAQIDVQT